MSIRSPETMTEMETNMGELRSAIQALRSEVVSALPDARIEDDFAELHRLSELLEVERLRRLAEIDRRRLFERDGHFSTTSWLANRFRVAWGTARRHSDVARALERMPVTRRALVAGDVSLSAVEMLALARDAHPDAFERSEEQLVEAARIHPMHDFRRVTSSWRQRVEREQGPGRDDELSVRRRLHASRTFQGMVRVDADLDPEAGESLLTALGAVMDAEARTGGDADVRSPAQRRADAPARDLPWLARSRRPRHRGR
jgi:hypothetical protein